MGRSLCASLILLFVALGASGSQAQSLALRSASAPVAGRFSAIHEELDRAADTALVDIVQRMAAAASDDGHTRSRSPESLVLSFDLQYRPAVGPGIRGAILRLDQLRPALEPVLRREGIPNEMASVIVVESGGRSDALSPKGALGLWQLTPDTARRYGLVVTPVRDDRLDVQKSTRAAARYLRDLYEEFGSWPLALAGYNAGERALQKAIDRAATSDFLQLSSLRLLPQETRNYVPAVLSVMQLLGDHHLPDAPETVEETVSSERIFALPTAQR